MVAEFDSDSIQSTQGFAVQRTVLTLDVVGTITILCHLEIIMYSMILWLQTKGSRLEAHYGCSSSSTTPDTFICAGSCSRSRSTGAGEGST